MARRFPKLTTSVTGISRFRLDLSHRLEAGKLRYLNEGNAFCYLIADRQQIKRAGKSDFQERLKGLLQ